jgi:FAD/FMN-containing dehydrogenase
MREWVNWSGSLRFSPEKFLQPDNENDLREIISRCYSSGRKAKLAAAGHSSSPLVKTGDVLIHLHQFRKLLRINREGQIATMQTGMTVHDTNKALQKEGHVLFNTGDVDVQTLAGAISTGPHGTGKKLQNLASMLQGVRMINYKGEIKTFTENDHPDIMKAMRVSLGAFGVFTEIDVKILPLFELQRLEICTDINTCMDHFDQLANENRNVDFYWYPRSDEAKIRILNKPGEGTGKFTFRHTLKKEEIGLAGDILPRTRELKFEETEFAFAAENGLECFRAVRKRVKEKYRKDVAWRVLVRTIAKDDSYLSPHYGRDSITISAHHNAGLPFEDYFKDLETIFMQYDGRPHWAKKHWHKESQLVSLYPDWNKFHEIRKELDPEDFFLNDHLKELFNPIHDE